MNYKEKYNEILEWARKNKARLNGVPIEEVLPELAESEDERMIERIELSLHSLKQWINGCDEMQPSRKEECITEIKEQEAWLEKQKEQEHICDSAQYEEGFKTGLEIGLRKQKEQNEIPLMGGDTDTYFDDLRITTKPLTSREWFDEGIKYAQRLQKEQKPEPVFKVGDKIKPKSELKYPYREIVDIKNGVYYFDEAVYLPFDNQDNWEKEQKPADLSEMMVHKEPYIAPVPTPMVADEQKPVKPSGKLSRKEYLYQLLIDQLITYSDYEYLTKQKPAEFTHHETNESLEEAVTHQMEDDGDVDDFVRRGIDDIALKYAELGVRWQKEQKQEWSEEDERRKDGVIQWLREYQKEFNPKYDSLSIDSIESLINWLKSLRPSWKPSEEQMKSLDIYRKVPLKHSIDREMLDSLYEQLKKLM